ncbi:MAG: hypothetical protein HY271_09580 [Deltaproteobacteria bacterium]|nr:hypothetical protein [Deltaproteobacteria bacterium]
MVAYAVVLGALLSFAAGTVGAATPVVAIIKSSTLPPFEQATQAIVTMLRHDPLQPEVLTFDLGGEERNGLDVLGRVHAAHASLIITVGSLATAAATAHTIEPVVFSMVLYPQQSGFHSTAAHGITGASLDIPVDLQFRYLRRLLPTAKRVGVLFDPAETGSVIEAAKEAAPKHGFTLVAKALDERTSAVDALETLTQDVDLVWAVADSHVFTPQTTSALVLATLRRRVPLIGLSAAHVRAGALAALYCDYDDIGKQTAEAALRVLRGENAQDIPISSPRGIGLALNLHTAEHLGVQVAAELQTEAGEVVR